MELVLEQNKKAAGNDPIGLSRAIRTNEEVSICVNDLAPIAPC